MLVAGELILSRRVSPQPSPMIVQGGDCGACVLGGALGLTVAQVYSTFQTDGITSKHEMSRLLRCSVSEGLADRMIDQHFEMHGSHWNASFGHPAFLESLHWFMLVRMAVDAGYYGIALVNYDAPSRDDDLGTNHWVLVCGARTDGSISGQRITGEILVSCSAGRLNGWHEARDFLRVFGGYDLLFVRPV